MVWNYAGCKIWFKVLDMRGGRERDRDRARESAGRERESEGIPSDIRKIAGSVIVRIRAFLILTQVKKLSFSTSPLLSPLLSSLSPYFFLPSQPYLDTKIGPLFRQFRLVSPNWMTSDFFDPWECKWRKQERRAARREKQRK
jgi:hypothetical protein